MEENKMIDPTNSLWIIADTYNWSTNIAQRKFHLNNPLTFVYADDHIWNFKGDGQIVNRSGFGVGTWEHDNDQPLVDKNNQPLAKHSLVTLRNADGVSHIEFVTDNFGIFYSAGQITKFLAREAAFHLDW